MENTVEGDPAAIAQGPKFARLSPGGEWIRTSSTRARSTWFVALYAVGCLGRNPPKRRQGFAPDPRRLGAVAEFRGPPLGYLYKPVMLQKEKAGECAQSPAHFLDGRSSVLRPVP